jgi:hypothetical protein
MPGGDPIFLLSRLALHTRNLLVDTRASLLLDATDSRGDSLAGARISLMGDIREDADPIAQRRFLARHPQAAAYATFADFAFFRMRVQSAHLIEGFGRITSLPGELLIDTSADPVFGGSEPAVLEALRHTPSSALAKIAQAPTSDPQEPWHISGVDPDGFDLASPEGIRRIAFPLTMKTPVEAESAIQTLLAACRP